MSIQQTTLSNGLTVLTDRMENVESISIGAYIAAGSRLENESNNGVAHFLEHMAFKGTEKRTALDIATQVEDVGGYMNAYTGREETAYHLKMMKEDMPLAADILGDILTHSTFEAKEIERERGVILQEYGEMLDTPDDMVFENLQEVMFPNHAIGRPILGSAHTIKGIDKKVLSTFISENYTTHNMLVAAAGNVKHEALVKEVEKAFSSLPTHQAPTPQPATFNSGTKVVEKGIEQTHIALTFEGVASSSADIYTLSLLAEILGGGSSSSRLFQEVREKRGLVYSVFSYLSSYDETGVFGIYAGTDAKDVPELMKTLKVELSKISEKVTDAEIKRAKAQLSASIRMGQESTESRMSRLARNHFVYGEQISLTEILNRIETVKVEDMTRLAAKIFSTPQALSVYGAKCEI